MSQITINNKGFSKTYKRLHELNTITSYRLLNLLDKYGKEGVEALKSMTPKDTGKTSESWYYTITSEKDLITISWNNSNTEKSIPIAVLLQYGHATRNGGYVQGIDYINPAMHPIFKKIANSAWKEVNDA